MVCVAGIEEQNLPLSLEHAILLMSQEIAHALAPETYTPGDAHIIARFYQSNVQFDIDVLTPPVCLDVTQPRFTEARKG